MGTEESDTRNMGKFLSDVNEEARSNDGEKGGTGGGRRSGRERAANEMGRRRG